MRLLPPHSGASEGGIPGAGGADGDMACVVCGEEEAHTPYVTDCGHVFCYYCLKTECLQDDQFSCPRCVVGVWLVCGWCVLWLSSHGERRLGLVDLR